MNSENRVDRQSVPPSPDPAVMNVAMTVPSLADLTMASSLTLPLVNASATHALGRSLGQQLPAGTVILLEGDLGAGKTSLVQGLGQGLGIEETIESPTFTLINEYFSGRLPLYHLDLYRLAPEETADLYLETYWDGSEAEPGIMAIEWCDRLPYKPDRYLLIQLTYPEATQGIEDEGRQVTLTAIGASSLATFGIELEVGVAEWLEKG
ncbi:tRNA (adenosine(37)-N6)-threonylcarbamoyltransferase complex ATPase subunit type 1 TsaE [Alkalinema pantanalense CENA528]|uniref:tRNA (adenosine(37)-N6)-threonylcarbamoyltransferase complex ATPase subunit type 1 TsaE n=1 Tax=Alkalinema pantanalense TaxID=1620705 RepID=UPI003D6DF8AA